MIFNGSCGTRAVCLKNFTTTFRHGSERKTFHEFRPLKKLDSPGGGRQTAAFLHFFGRLQHPYLCRKLLRQFFKSLKLSKKHPADVRPRGAQMLV
jgi:hypothetical protein